MDEKKDNEKKRSPERVKQHRACAGFDELTQDAKVAMDGRCAPGIAVESTFERRREYVGAKSIFEPGTEPAQYGAAQRIEHASDDDSDRNDQREHQQRGATAARQDAIIDLKQVDGRSKEQQIVAAAIGEHDAKLTSAGPQRRLQWGLWRHQQHIQPEGRHQHRRNRHRFRGSTLSLDINYKLDRSARDSQRPAARAAGPDSRTGRRSNGNIDVPAD